MPDSEDIQAAPRGGVPALGLGERLRSARKAKALSVQQVAESLRLEEASVVALEEGRFDAMGAPVFVRGHLKRYARLVGLSPEAVLEAYRAAAPNSDTLPALARPREPSDSVRLGPWAWWIAGALLILGIMLALRDDDDPVAPAPATSSVPASPDPAPPPVYAPGPAAPAASPEQAAGSATPATGAPGTAPPEP
jgi:cytoskeleton protein RodZ